MESVRIMAAVALVGGMAMNPAFAQGEPSMGISLGNTTVDDFCDGSGSGVSCDDSDTGMKIYVGNDFSDSFRVEGFWTDLGEVEASASGDSASAEASGLGVAGMFLAPISDTADLFLKGGIFMWDVDYEASIGSLSGSDNEDGTDPFFGVGARARISEQVSVRGEWERFEIDDEDVTLLSIGAALHF